MPRVAQPQLRFTLRGVSIVFRGRVVARCPDTQGADRFLTGWRKAEAEAAAERARRPASCPTRAGAAIVAVVAACAFTLAACAGPTGPYGPAEPAWTPPGPVGCGCILDDDD